VAVTLTTHIRGVASCALVVTSMTVSPAFAQAPAATALVTQRLQSPSAGAPGLADAPELRAQLAPRRYTTLAAEIGARVQRLTVRDGSTIRAGELLVEFDCSMQQAQFERAQVSLGAAEKQLATQRRLVELNATGRQELDQAEAEVGKTRAEMSQIKVQLGKCRITAPFSGRVAEQKVREQQFAQPGQALLEILDDSVLEVEFIMPSRWLAQVRTGSDVRIAVDETGREYPAKVQRVGAKVDPVSQSIKVVAAITGRPPELVAGMSGRVIVQRQP
jgi:membrane fusion protein (multidrug efflux system)